LICPRHRRKEAVAAQGHGFDEARILWRIAQRLAQLVDGGVQAVIEVDEGVFGPQSLAEVIARDDAASLEEHLGPALELDALITTAGASVGDHDLVKDILERMGMRTAFWRVRIRPGSPFSFGLIPRSGREALPVFGLPGNPVSALVTFEVLVKPALRKMQGRTKVHSKTMHVRAAARIQSPPGLVRFLRVTLERQGSEWLARLTGEQGSGILSSVARADALLIMPIDVDTLEAGEPAIALPLAAADDAQESIGF